MCAEREREGGRGERYIPIAAAFVSDLTTISFPASEEPRASMCTHFTPDISCSVGVTHALACVVCVCVCVCVCACVCLCVAENRRVRHQCSRKHKERR